MEHAYRELLDIGRRAKSAGDHKTAVAALRGVISIAKLTPDDGGVLEDLVSELQELSDEQLGEIANGNVTATSGSGATTTEDEQQPA